MLVVVGAAAVVTRVVVVGLPNEVVRVVVVGVPGVVIRDVEVGDPGMRIGVRVVGVPYVVAYDVATVVGLPAVVTRVVVRVVGTPGVVTVEVVVGLPVFTTSQLMVERRGLKSAGVAASAVMTVRAEARTDTAKTATNVLLMVTTNGIQLLMSRISLKMPA